MLHQAMKPPMQLPWSDVPSHQVFGDFWVPRGSCEYYAETATSPIRSVARVGMESERGKWAGGGDMTSQDMNVVFRSHACALRCM